MNTNGKPELIMKQLNIKQQATYEHDAGKYKVTINYAHGESEHTLTLDPIISERVLAFIGPVICEAAAMVAEQTRRNITCSIEALNNQKAIEAGPLVNAGVEQTEAPKVVEQEGF